MPRVDENFIQGRFCQKFSKSSFGPKFSTLGGFFNFETFNPQKVNLRETALFHPSRAKIRPGV